MRTYPGFKFLVRTHAVGNGIVHRALPEAGHV